MGFPRLDEWLVENGHYSTRARARDAIKRGCVTMDDVVAKPSRSVVEPNAVKISDPALTLVSRAALKLEKALDDLDLSPAGMVALDLGASTGGFCQVLLNRGASKVFAVDVGHDQLDPRLTPDPRIVNLEGVNARALTADHLSGERPDIVTSDLSFISLTLALPPALTLAADGAHGIFLVKPQFEVGREFIGRGGIVRDADVAREKADELFEWLNTQPGWQATSLMKSPIAGGDGNTEYLMVGRKNG